MKPSVAAILKKSFADRAAIESLARRKERITSHSHEVWNEEHARAFTIAGLARLDILQEIRAGLERTVSGDLSRTEWESDVRALLKDAGLWTDKEGKRRSKADAGKFAPSRLRLIFDTNTASAYAAGRWTRLWERRETHPYLMYLTKQDERVRITHRRWHGLVLPIEHPFWQTHYPPNGFRCRCAVLGVTQAEYDRAHSGEETEIAGQLVHLDAPPEMTVAHVNRATGEIVQVPVGITPGFNYNPGMALSRERELAALVAQKTAGLDDAMLQAHVAATRTQPLSGSANTAPETAPAPETKTKPKIAAAIPGQPTYADLGLPKLKDVPEELRLPAPELLSAAPTREEALAVFARELGVSAETPLRWIETKIPVPNLSVIGIDYSDLPHIVQKEQDARERFARFVLATITDPFEVWETEYDDGTTRPRLIGLFQGKRQIVVIVRINPNGSKLYNILNAGDDRLDKLRVGRLLYGRLKM